MLTWAVSYAIVNAGIPAAFLLAGVVGDVLIALFLVAALRKTND